jgi:hypothetical protein
MQKYVFDVVPPNLFSENILFFSKKAFWEWFHGTLCRCLQSQRLLAGALLGDKHGAPVG